MPPIYFYVIVFVTGVVSSALMMLFVAYYYIPSSLIRERKLSNYMSEEHYLQVRDDYHLFDPSLFDPMSDHLVSNVQPKRRHEKSAEGEQVLHFQRC